MATTYRAGRRLAGLAARLRPVILASIAAVLTALCCLPTHIGKFVLVPALVLGAAASLFTDAARRGGVLRGARDLQFLAFAFGWLLISGVVLMMRVPTITALLANIVLLALLGVLLRGVCATGLQRQCLVLLVALTVFGIILSMVAQLRSGQSIERLGSVALNGMIIPAAGGYACAILAAIALWRTTPAGRLRAWALPLAGVVMVVALAWSESRGPIIALVLALLSIPILDRISNRFGLAAACLIAFAGTTCAILMESHFHAAFCTSSVSRVCEPSKRLELWGWAVDSIAHHPIFGVGFGNYFADEHRPHPHNGLLSLAFFAGLPFLLAFLALSVGAAIRMRRMPRSPLTFYAAPALVFGFGYMGTDLANVVGFIGTHYLFIWIPIFAAYAQGDPSWPSRPAAGVTGVPHLDSGVC